MEGSSPSQVSSLSHGGVAPVRTLPFTPGICTQKDSSYAWTPSHSWVVGMGQRNLQISTE